MRRDAIDLPPRAGGACTVDGDRGGAGLQRGSGRERGRGREESRREWPNCREAAERPSPADFDCFGSLAAEGGSSRASASVCSADSGEQLSSDRRPPCTRPTRIRDAVPTVEQRNGRGEATRGAAIWRVREAVLGRFSHVRSAKQRGRVVGVVARWWSCCRSCCSCRPFLAPATPLTPAQRAPPTAPCLSRPRS